MQLLGGAGQVGQEASAGREGIQFMAGFWTLFIYIYIYIYLFFLFFFFFYFRPGTPGPPKSAGNGGPDPPKYRRTAPGNRWLLKPGWGTGWPPLGCPGQNANFQYIQKPKPRNYTCSGTKWFCVLADEGGKAQKPLVSWKCVFFLALVPQASPKTVGPKTTTGSH